MASQRPLADLDSILGPVARVPRPPGSAVCAVLTYALSLPDPISETDCRSWLAHRYRYANRDAVRSLARSHAWAGLVDRSQGYVAQRKPRSGSVQVRAWRRAVGHALGSRLGQNRGDKKSRGSGFGEAVLAKSRIVTLYVASEIARDASGYDSTLLSVTRIAAQFGWSRGAATRALKAAASEPEYVAHCEAEGCRWTARRVARAGAVSAAEGHLDSKHEDDEGDKLFRVQRVPGLGWLRVQRRPGGSARIRLGRLSATEGLAVETLWADAVGVLAATTGPADQRADADSPAVPDGESLLAAVSRTVGHPAWHHGGVEARLLVVALALAAGCEAADVDMTVRAFNRMARALDAELGPDWLTGGGDELSARLDAWAERTGARVKAAEVWRDYERAAEDRRARVAAVRELRSREERVVDVLCGRDLAGPVPSVRTNSERLERWCERLAEILQDEGLSVEEAAGLRHVLTGRLRRVGHSQKRAAGLAAWIIDEATGSGDAVA